MTHEDRAPGVATSAAPFGRIPAWLPFVLYALGAGVVMLRQRTPAIDLPAFAAGGAELVQGRLGSLYADTWMQAGPLELLGSLLVWPSGGRHGRAWVDLVDYGSYRPWHALLAVAMVLVLWQAIGRARRATGLADDGWVVLLAISVGLLLRLPYITLSGGHLSQVVVPFWWLWAGTLAFRGRSVRAAVLLGLSCGWEPWAFLGFPVLLLDGRVLPRRLADGPGLAGVVSAWRGPVARLTVLGVVFLVCSAALYLPFALTGHFALFEHDWPVNPHTIIGRLIHRGDGFSWYLRLLQGGVTLLAGVVLAVVLRGRVESVWLVPFVVQVVRLLLDPLDIPYYWTPLMVLGVFGLGLLPSVRADGRLFRVLLIVTLPQLQALAVFPELRDITDLVSPPALGAAVCLFLALLVALDLVRALRRRGRRTGPVALVGDGPAIVPGPRPAPDLERIGVPAGDGEASRAA